MISFSHQHKVLAMKNGVIIYIEDTECGNVRVTGEVVGQPDQSKELADGILVKVMAHAHDALAYLTPQALQ